MCNLLSHNYNNIIVSIIQISALGLDPAGARLITGSYDYDIKFWDFAGMDNSLQSFRSMTPCGTLVIINACHSIIITSLIP